MNSTNSILNCHNPRAMKIFTRLRLGLSHPRGHKFKVKLSTSKNICFIFFNENTLKMREYAFYFKLKALFVLKIIKFFVNCLVIKEKRHD